MNQIYFVLVYYLSPFQAIQARSEKCRGERSQQGFALFYKNYTSSVTNNYSDCLDLCIDDPSCMSLNFWLDTSQCDLNSHSRETCPACYMEAPARYMGMARYPGNIIGGINFKKILFDCTRRITISISLLKNQEMRSSQPNFQKTVNGLPSSFNLWTPFIFSWFCRLF